jgi:hypothetical protein
LGWKAGHVRSNRKQKIRPYTRATVEQRAANLRSQLANHRLVRDEAVGGAGLLLCEMQALLKALDGETLNAGEKDDLRSAKRTLLRYEGRLGRELLTTFRGDRALRDEPEFEPSGCYYDDRPSIRAADLVNVDDLTRETRQSLALLGA